MWLFPWPLLSIKPQFSLNPLAIPIPVPQPLAVAHGFRCPHTARGRDAGISLRDAPARGVAGMEEGLL